MCSTRRVRGTCAHESRTCRPPLHKTEIDATAGIAAKSNGTRAQQNVVWSRRKTSFHRCGSAMRCLWRCIDQEWERSLTGEKQSTKCRFFRARSRKNVYLRQTVIMHTIMHAATCARRGLLPSTCHVEWSMLFMPCLFATVWSRERVRTALCSALDAHELSSSLQHTRAVHCSAHGLVSALTVKNGNTACRCDVAVSACRQHEQRTPRGMAIVQAYLLVVERHRMVSAAST